MPSGAHPLASDPKRVLEQMLITAPFYAGISYSFGGLLAKKFGSVAQGTKMETGTGNRPKGW